MRGRRRTFAGLAPWASLSPLLMLPRLRLFFLGWLTASTAVAQTTTPQTIKPPLTNVTVYLNGTALEHHAPLPLAAGLNRVILSGISPRIEDQSLEVQLGDGAELVSVSDNEDADAPDPVWETRATRSEHYPAVLLGVPPSSP